MIPGIRRRIPMTTVNELWSWLAGLDPTFAFLVALPFAVGALGLAALALERRRVARPRATRVRSERGARHAHVQ
jgi:hypothetical protein